MNMKVYIVSNDTKFLVRNDIVPGVGDRVRWLDWSNDGAEREGIVRLRKFDYTDACVYLYVDEET